MDIIEASRHKLVIRDICQLDWPGLNATDLTAAAWAYYHFSVQFRENLEIAVGRHPGDEKLLHLQAEECGTSNLSPWPKISAVGERMNHDEFMLRALTLAPIDETERMALTRIGETYLRNVRALADQGRAMSIASYEDGGLESVFRAILTAPDWSGPVLQAFRHFLNEHIRFDSDPDQGHGVPALVDETP